MVLFGENHSVLILQYVLFGQKEYLFGGNKSNQLIEDVFLIQTICDTEKLSSEMILNERKWPRVHRGRQGISQALGQKKWDRIRASI